MNTMNMKNLGTFHRNLRHSLVLIYITPVIVPIVFLDIFIEIYHRVAFPLCRIPMIKRSSYVRIDRQKLEYLNWLQKLYCIYCGYANGVMNYWVKIAAETEKYWCAVQHEKCDGFIFPKHHKDFPKYGDAKHFKDRSLEGSAEEV